MMFKMGHDITAYQDKRELAYLRRNMSSTAVHQLYQVLDSIECYGGCSGNGESRSFFVEEIKAALETLEQGPEATKRPTHYGDYIVESLGGVPSQPRQETDLEQEFLRKILQRVEGSDPIEILFT